MADKILTPLKAIRAKCMDCCCGQAKEIKLCNLKNCPLYPYRMGKRPKDDKDIGSGGIEEKTISQQALFWEMCTKEVLFLLPDIRQQKAAQCMKVTTIEADKPLDKALGA